MATINNRSNYVFKGHKALLGSKFVTYGEVELNTRYEKYSQSDSFNWGDSSSGSKQLAFSMLCQLSDEEFAAEYTPKFADEVVRKLNSRDWVLNASDVISWIKENSTHISDENVLVLESQKVKKKVKKKTNVVKKVCTELQITQKNLAQILEVPEGTVSSWAVKNEIPRLGKKAIEFYIEKQKNQQIVDSYKSFVNLLNAS